MMSRAFVLRTIKHGESDLIVRLLDREGSRITVAARGAMRSKKRFGGGVLEPSHFIEAVYTMGRGDNDVGLLQEARLINGFVGLRLDYDRVQLALKFVSLIDRVGREAAPDSQHLFDLLGNALRSCETSKNLAKLRVHFEVKLLAQQGILPHDFDFATMLSEYPLVSADELPLETGQVAMLLDRAEHMLDAYLGRSSTALR
jgi:DNA repair protein RecO (recombination protein O)